MTFTTILNLSISASWLVLAVIVLRLVLKKAPKALHCALWTLVAIRLLCPLSLESELSLIPSREVFPQSYITMEPAQQSAPPKLEIVTNPVYDTPITIDVDTTVDRVQCWDVSATVIWLAGMAAMGIYAAFSYLSLRLRLRMAVPVEGRVWACDALRSPFILGLLRPRIYLPSDLAEDARVHVLAHENAHLKRLDHIWKPLGFGLLAIHWFNPVMWLAYILLCRDIELACDERVIRKLDKPQVRAYSEALVRCAVNHRSIAACPLAFGEVGVKGRIKAMVRYKNPGFWVLLTAVLLSTATAVCFLTDPPAAEPESSELPARTFARSYGIRGTQPMLNLDGIGTYTIEGLARGEILDTGVYTEKDQELILKSNNGDRIWYFIGSDAGWYYDQDRSDGLSFHTADGMILRTDDGALFPLTTQEPVWTRYAIETGDLFGPSFSISDNGTFTLTTSPLSSYLGYGSYTIEGNTICLKTDDGKFRWCFTRDGDDYRFDANASSPISCLGLDGKIYDTADGVCFVQQAPMPSTSEIDAAIRAARRGTEPMGNIAVQSHRLLDSAELCMETSEGGVMMLRLWVLSCYQEFTADSGSMTLDREAFGILELMYQREGDALVLLECRPVDDHQELLPEIRERIPGWEQQYAAELRRECAVQANGFFAQHLEAHHEAEKLMLVVELYLKNICSSPAQSSAPGDYIEAHYEEYRWLRHHPDYTLRYCFAEFAKGNQTDLRGHIMAIVCQDIILGGDEDCEAIYGMTGQDWFNNFAAQAEKRREQMAPEDFGRNHPACSLALSMLGI